MKKMQNLARLSEFCGEIRRTLRKTHSLSIMHSSLMDKGTKREWEAAIQSLNLMLQYVERDINRLQHHELFSDLDDICEKERQSSLTLADHVEELLTKNGR